VNPVLLVVAGPNGAGKTTVTKRLREEHWSEGVEYLNPDDVARDRFGDWNSPHAILEAARWTDARREGLLRARRSIAFETVFSSPGKIDFLERAKASGSLSCPRKRYQGSRSFSPRAGNATPSPRFATPRTRQANPRARIASALAGNAASHAGNASPRPRFATPRTRQANPYARIASALAGNAAPRAGNASASPRFAIPWTRQANPHARIASALAGNAAPHAGKRSPSARVDARLIKEPPEAAQVRSLVLLSPPPAPDRLVHGESSAAPFPPPPCTRSSVTFAWSDGRGSDARGIMTNRIGPDAP
jgi:hypothetical protein